MGGLWGCEYQTKTFKLVCLGNFAGSGSTAFIHSWKVICQPPNIENHYITFRTGNVFLFG